MKDNRIFGGHLKDDRIFGHLELCGKFLAIDRALLCLLIDAIYEMDYTTITFFSDSQQPVRPTESYCERQKATQNKLKEFIHTLSKEDVEEYTKEYKSVSRFDPEAEKTKF